MDKSIENRAKEYAPYAFDPDYILPIREEYIVNQQRNAYIAGAREQKSIDEEVRLKKCDDMTPKECEREMAFVDWYYKNGKGTPTFSDAIEWARQKTTDEACEWLKNNWREYVYQDGDGIVHFGHWEADMRKSIEE